MQSQLATHLSQQEKGLQGLMDRLLPITVAGPMPPAALNTPADGPSPAGGSPTLCLSGALLSPFALQPPPPPHEQRLHHSLSVSSNSGRLRQAAAELVGDVEDTQLENTLTAARYHRYGRACMARGYGEVDDDHACVCMEGDLASDAGYCAL